jgi:hypothetical protein
MSTGWIFTLHQQRMERFGVAQEQHYMVPSSGGGVHSLCDGVATGGRFADRSDKPVPKCAKCAVRLAEMEARQ